MCERWVGDCSDCNILTPSSSVFSDTSFSFCSTRGPGGLSPLLGASSHCLKLQRELQLTDSSCGTGLYNCLTSTCFLWASHLRRIQPDHMSRLYLDIFDRMHLFLDWPLIFTPVHMSKWYLQMNAPVSRLTAGSKVNMLHYEETNGKWWTKNQSKEQRNTSLNVVFVIHFLFSFVQP